MLLSRLRILQVFVEMVAGSHLKTLERPFEATCVKVGKSVVTLGPYSGTRENAAKGSRFPSSIKYKTFHNHCLSFSGNEQYRAMKHKFKSLSVL